MAKRITLVSGLYREQFAAATHTKMLEPVLAKIIGKFISVKIFGQ